MKNAHLSFLSRRVSGLHDFGSISRSAEKRPFDWLRTWVRFWWLTCFRFVLVAAMILAFSASFAGAGAMFTLTNVGLPGVAYSSVVCADFNNAGKPAVVLTGVGGGFNGIAQVWQCYSNGLFTNLNAALPGVSSSAVARGDFDNDGRTDLLLTGFAGVDGDNFPVYLSEVWRNLGNGTFTNIQAGLPGVDTGAVALGDFDNDGNLDILLTGYCSTGAVAQVWRNLGNGKFTNINAGLPGVLYSAVALGDFDNDGKLDILLTGTPNGFGNAAITQLWRNLGNNTFTNIPIGLPGVSQGAVAWADFDQDGKLDILLSGYSTNGPVCQVWRNLGNGVFTNMNVGLPGIYRSSIAVADFDNDGKLDLILAGADTNSNPICQVWRNTGNWVFTNMNAGLPGVHYGSVAWADFDNDGRLDLLLAGLDAVGNPMLQVYHNNSASNNGVAPRIKSLKALASRAHQLSFDGQSGFGYTVWGSTNLLQWAVLGSPNEGGPAAFQFTDTQPANLHSRFYRLSRP